MCLHNVLDKIPLPSLYLGEFEIGHKILFKMDHVSLW